MISPRHLFIISVIDISIYTALFYYCFWILPMKIGNSTTIPVLLLFIYPILSNQLQKKNSFEIGLNWGALKNGIMDSLAIGIPLGFILFFMGSTTAMEAYANLSDIRFGNIVIKEASLSLFAGLYLFFCFFQQYILFGFFFNRFEIICYGNKKLIFVCTLTIFILSHFPNPHLMFLSLVGGTLFLVLFFRNRNILPLIFLHGLLGFLITRILSVHQISFAIGQYFNLLKY